MGKCLNTFKKPSMDEFCDYIEKHGFDLDPFDLYKEFDKKNKLDNEYKNKERKLINEQIVRKGDLEEEYKKKARDLEEKYARMTGDFEAEKNRVFNKLPNIASMATDLRDELTKIRFFKPKLAIKLANDIIRYSSKWH